MEGIALYPLERSMCILAIVISLLVCLVMGILKKVLRRNNILFFFWFMVNIVYQLLEVTELGRSDVLPYRHLIQIIYVINTVVILIALAAGIRHGVRNAFTCSEKEWAYIGVNGLAVFVVLSAVTNIVKIAGTKDAALKLILWIEAGVVTLVGAVGADLYWFKDFHIELRNTSPERMYDLLVGIFAAELCYALTSGMEWIGFMFTITMILSLNCYLLSSVSAAPSAAPVVIPAVTETETPEEEGSVRIIHEERPEEVYELLRENPALVSDILNLASGQIDHQPKNAKRTLLHLSAYLQNKHREFTAEHLFSFQSELETLSHFFAMEELRFPERFSYEESIAVTSFSLPGLTLLTIGEHITSLIERREEGGSLKLETEEGEGEVILRFCAKDGLQEADLSRIFAEHPLLRNVKDTLAETYGGSFHIRVEEETTVYDIRIPRH